MSLENPMPGSQTPQAGTSQPTHPAYPMYPAYPTYPAYPPYAANPYYAYAGAPQPGYPPQPIVQPIAPVLPPVPSRAPDKPASQRQLNRIVAIVLAVATIAALALSAAAPALVTRDLGPHTTRGFVQVYNSPLRDDTNNWDVGNGCAFEQGGLHATNQSSGTLCLFTSSRSIDYTSGGFYLTTRIAPAGAVNSVEAACVQFAAIGSGGDITTFAIDQNGNYALQSNAGTGCSPTAPLGVSQQETAAWHASGEIPNDLSIRYDAANRVITVYANGQQILSEGWLFGSQYSISLGSAANDEAIFASFGLWSTQA